MEKKQQQQQNRHGKEKLSCLCRLFFNVTLADYNKLRQELVNKSKCKMGKKIYVYIASLILGLLNTLKYAERNTDEKNRSHWSCNSEFHPLSVHQTENSENRFRF